MNVLDWARLAEVGDVQVYYTGTIDTYRTAREKESFWTAQEAHEKGLVFLSQKRINYDKMAYQATRVSKRTLEVLAKISECEVSDAEASRRNVFVRRHPASSSVRIA